MRDAEKGLFPSRISRRIRVNWAVACWAFAGIMALALADRGLTIVWHAIASR